MDQEHDAYGALRHGDFRRVLAGSVLATIATQMQGAALEWELYQRTGDARYLGWIGLVQFLPVLFLSLPAGQAADHYSRKGLVIVSQLLIATAALGLAVLSWMEAPAEFTYACLLVTGIARAFYLPARWALISQVVPGHLLANAVAWNSSGLQIALAAGPALGGALIAYVGPIGAYRLAACCATVCVLLIASTHPVIEARPPLERSLASLLAGARFVWRTKPILATITLDLFAVLFGGATALLAIFAKDTLQVGPVGYGWLRLRQRWARW